jgi:hypothetical protein
MDGWMYGMNTSNIIYKDLDLTLEMYVYTEMATMMMMKIGSLASFTNKAYR